MNLTDLFKDSQLRSQLVNDEGVKCKPYKDTRGFWTAGVGHNLTAHNTPMSQIEEWLKTTIPDTTIKMWFTDDIKATIATCEKAFTNFASLPDEVQRVLMNMTFDLMNRIDEWHDLRHSIESRNWIAAAGDVMNSHFAKQAHDRCQRLADRLKALG